MNLVHMKSSPSMKTQPCVYVCVYLCRAEKRLLGLRRTGPIGNMVPRSLTQCRYPLVMSAMPMARAEQYMNLYPFLCATE